MSGREMRGKIGNIEQLGSCWRDSLGVGGCDIQKLIWVIITNYLSKASFKMQSPINECSILSFVLFPCSNTYFAFTPVTAASPLSPSTPQQISSSYFFSSQMEPLYLGQESQQAAGDCLGNLQQNREMSDVENQTNIQGLLPERNEPLPYSPVVLSYNGESASTVNKWDSFQIRNSVGNKKQNIRQQKGKGKKAVVDEDKEYNPQSERRRKTATKYQENQNRNIIPNEINQIFSFLQKKGKSGAIAQKLFQKFPHPAEYSLKRYYLYQSLLKNKLGHYTNQKSLRLVTELYEPKCENWSEQEQRYYNKISRVLIRHFLHEDSIFMILTSKRMKSEKKADHIRARRYVKQAVLKILKGC